MRFFLMTYQVRRNQPIVLERRFIGNDEAKLWCEYAEWEVRWYSESALGYQVP